jgi:RimJ/RimL family protein N-acetyltransferase
MPDMAHPSAGESVGHYHRRHVTDGRAAAQAAGNIMTLNTPRLRLVSHTRDNLLGIIESVETYERRSGLRAADGLRDFFVSGEVSPAWVQKLRESAPVDVWLHGFAVVEQGRDEVIGGIGFKGPPDAEGMVEIGYGIVASREGRGYATEAAAAVVDFAFKQPAVRVVRAHTLPQKNASTRVLGKCGFTHLGEVVDPEDGQVWRWERRKAGGAFELQPTLTGELLHLRPLREEDFAQLYAVASDPFIWEVHPARDRYKREVFEQFFSDAMKSGGAFLVADCKSEGVIGSSRYFGYDPAKSEVEIGWTFLARSHWGGKHNFELKRLMLRHAFRFVENVVFLVGPQNWRSQRAMEKIGGVFIGTRTGSTGQESVVYLITRPSFEAGPLSQSP